MGEKIETADGQDEHGWISGLEIGWGRFGERNSAEFEFGPLEVEDQPYFEARRSEIVQHSSNFVVGDAVDGLGIDYDSIEGGEVGHILADLHATVGERVAGLLGAGD